MALYSFLFSEIKLASNHKKWMKQILVVIILPACNNPKKIKKYICLVSITIDMKLHIENAKSELVKIY